MIGDKHEESTKIPLKYMKFKNRILLHVKILLFTKRVCEATFYKLVDDKQLFQELSTCFTTLKCFLKFGNVLHELNMPKRY